MTESTAGLLDAAFTHLDRLSDDTGLFEHARGHNANQGAESTLALISTLQQGIRIAGRG